MDLSSLAKGIGKPTKETSHRQEAFQLNGNTLSRIDSFVEQKLGEKWWAFHLRRDVYPGEIAKRCRMNPTECRRLASIEDIMHSGNIPSFAFDNDTVLYLATNSHNTSEIRFLRGLFNVVQPTATDDPIFDIVQDQETCERASFFLGSPVSSFSKKILEASKRRGNNGTIW